MSTLTSLISAGGGGGGTPVNTIAQLNVGGQTLYEDPSGGEWLKTGNILTSGLASYPDAVVKKRPLMSSITYDGVSYNTSFVSRGFHFNPDGTRLYVTNFSTQVISQYNLSTPWDITTATYSKSSNFPLNAGSPIFSMSPDGRFLYGSSGSGGQISVFELNTPYELNNPSFNSPISVSIQYPQFSFGSTSGSTNSNFGYPAGLQASYCGNYLYVATTNGMVLQLRVPNGGEFENSNVVYMYAEGYTGLGNSAFGNGVHIDITGENILANHRLDNNDIQLHAMSSNNISTARYVTKKNEATGGAAKHLFLKPDCTKLYISSGSGIIYQFSVTPEEYIGSPGSANQNEYIKIK